MTAVEQELDFGPAPSDHQDIHVLVPIHADNWALALASGYLGGALRDDQARDLQSLQGDNLAGFRDEIPSWALEEGEVGPRVILRVAVEKAPRSPGGVIVVEGPLPVTRVQEACFGNKEELDNFRASYGLFPDVPDALVPCVVGGFPVNQGGKPTDLVNEKGGAAISEKRRQLDFFGGWAAAVLSILELGEHDSEIRRMLVDGDSGLGALAQRTLRAFDETPSQLDLAIWKAALQGLHSRFGKKGFDRQDFLSGIEEQVGAISDEALAWIHGCRKVITAEKDIPSLDDQANIGRRAALALMLAHEPASVVDLESTLGTGPKVQALVMQAAYAFAGLARLDAKNKLPADRLNGLHAVSRGLMDGGGIDVTTEAHRVGSDLSRVEQVSICGHHVLERTVQAPPYLLMLKARAQEAGYQVTVDQDLGELVIKAKRPRSPSIFVEDNDRSSAAQPVVNLVLPIAKLGARPATSVLKSYLELAFNQATTVGLRRRGEVEEVCAMASIPLATLDRDEFSFHVERLLALWTQAVGAKSKGAKKRSPVAKEPPTE